MNILTKQHTDFMIGMTPLKAIDFLSLLNNTQSSNQLNVGDFYQGGYFAGYIVVDLIKYALIVAPKETGETQIQFRTSNDTTSGIQSVNDGWSNTNAMNNNSHPAAKWTRSLNVGGFTDWYLPSRDELEICYRSFKPDNTANYVYTGGHLPNGNGYNENSSPVGVAYTSSVPGQTSVTAFKTGGSEVFNAAWYWTSSEFAFNPAFSWGQNFSNGVGTYSSKTITIWVRAVRRVPV